MPAVRFEDEAAFLSRKMERKEATRLRLAKRIPGLLSPSRDVRATNLPNKGIAVPCYPTAHVAPRLSQASA